nr:MAG TPA: hypothetical protein [Caudoviricetes sp.]
MIKRKYILPRELLIIRADNNLVFLYSSREKECNSFSIL